MAPNPLRDGFREVLNDPALLLIEIAWRWSFGLIAFFVCAAAGLLLLGRVNIDPHRFQGLVALGPWQLAQVLAASVAAIRFTLLRVSVAVGLILSLCWIVLSAVGRHATLVRPALAPGPTLRACFAISAARAGVTVASIIAWMAAGMFAGLVSVSGSDAAMPNLALITAILLPALILIVAVWVTANWYLSLAPLLPEETWVQSLVNAWNWSRLHRDQLFEISIAVTAIRVILLVVALMLSVAVSAVVTNLRVVAVDLLAITLLYFLVADFLYVVKLAAYAKLKQPEKGDSRVLAKATDLSVPVSDSFFSR